MVWLNFWDNGLIQTQGFILMEKELENGHRMIILVLLRR